MVQRNARQYTDDQAFPASSWRCITDKWGASMHEAGKGEGRVAMQSMLQGAR